MVSITNHFLFVSNRLQVSEYWVGLKLKYNPCLDKCRRKGWQWDNGVPLPDDSKKWWYGSEPSGTDLCVRVEGSGLSGAKCSKKYHYCPCQST